MTDQEIVDAINKARLGISKYLAIMDALHSTDVSTDAAFQTKYKGFYRVRQRSAAWYSSYFLLMEESKGRRPEFSQVISELRSRIGNAYEPSFSSKLVATLNPWRPMWDEHVLRNTGHKPPSYSSATKHADAIAAYASIVSWYEAFMKSSEGRRWVRLFNENAEDYYRITDIKKVDFILWQTRA